ncbi:MAG TPA: hypothetical protein VMB27_09885 [Solirubrobacteraceae bacterium]|nr:hypothetical protein [Solirubrobacteraceae bacterium]
MLVALTVAGLLGVAGAIVLVVTSRHETGKAFEIVAGGVVAPARDPSRGPHRARAGACDRSARGPRPVGRVLAVLKYLQAPATAR